MLSATSAVLIWAVIAFAICPAYQSSSLGLLDDAAFRICALMLFSASASTLSSNAILYLQYRR
jgi:hypothetical protein